MGLSLVVVVLLMLVVIFMAKTISQGRMLEQIKWDLMKIKHFENRLDALELQLGERKRRAEPDETKRAEHQAINATPAKPPAPVIPQVGEERKPEPAIAPPSAAHERLDEQPSRSRTREEWEAFVGGKLLNRIGALALIIGVGLFLKYAFDKNWISEPIRVMTGAVAGILCLAGAYRTHSKGLKIFAQGLVGAGIAILYLSVYASFNFYALVPQWVAFVLMSIVTTIALAQAFYYDSLAVALLGWLGGFMTPIMLSTGHPNEVGLFTYLALLSAGLLATLLKKKSWAILELLTLAGLWILYLAWYIQYYDPQNLLTTVFFVSLFWMLFYALDVFQALRAPGESDLIHHSVATGNGAILFCALYALLDHQHHEWMGTATLILGLMYFGTIVLAGLRTLLSPTVKARYLVSSMILLATATAIQFDDFTTVIVWSLESIALIWCGLRWRLRYVWQLALGLFAIGMIKMFATDGTFEFVRIREFTLLASQRTLTLAVAGISAGLGAWFMTRFSGGEKSEAVDWTKDALNFAWCGILFILLTVETNDYFRWRMLDQSFQNLEALSFTRLLTLPVVWVLCSLSLTWLSVRKEMLTVIVAALGMVGLAALLAASRGIAYEPLATFTPLLNTRVTAMLFVFAAMIIQELIISGRMQTWEWLSQVRNVLQIAVAIFLLVLLTGESRDYFEKQIANVSGPQEGIEASDVLDRLHNLQQLSLSGVWLIFSVGLMAAGIWRSVRNYRIVAFVLFGITILKIFIYDLSFLDTLYRIYSFIGLGVILLAVSYVYQRYKDVIFGTAMPTKI